MDYLMMLFHDSSSAGLTQDCHQNLHSPDTLFIWRPGSPQYYGNETTRFCHTWIHCTGRFIRKILKSSRIPIERPIPVKNPSVFQQSLILIHTELISHRNPDPVIVSNLLENSIREMARSAQPSDMISTIPDELLSVQRVISDSSSKPWTLPELARIAGMSVPHFSARFKEVFGLAPMHYLIQQRMQHAAYLLSDQNMTISQIAEKTGFSDPFHFSKMFKKHFGKSPRALRKKQNDG